MIAVAVSDLHGYLPILPEHGIGVLIVAGDISPQWFENDRALMLQWLDTNFRHWLEDARELGYKDIIGIAGNHDAIFASDLEAVDGLVLPWIYLQDSAVEIDDQWVYGLPWVANLKGWPFYQPREKLDELYGQIPADIDIIISHQPPIGYGDGGHPEWCSGAVNGAIERVKPKALVCGHIHEGFGIYQNQATGTNIYNVSFVDENYEPRHRPVKVIAL